MIGFMAIWPIVDHGSVDRQVATAKTELALMLLARGLVALDEPGLAFEPDHVQFEGRAARNCKCIDGDKGRDGATHPDILRAYEAARSARFEHGERG